MESDTKNRVKFLIIRLSSIGDIVLTTPVIRMIKQQVENSEIHFITKPAFIDVLKANPYIDTLHEFTGINSSIKKLKKEQFHYIIDLHNNLRSTIIKSRLKAISFSFKKLNIEKWLMVNFKIDRLPEKHIVDRYLETVKLFDVKNDQKGVDYFIPPEDEVNILNLPQPFHNGYVLVAIGGNHYTKKLPPEKIIPLCRELKLPVIMVGNKDDRDLADIIEDGCSGPIYNACGNYNINQSASLTRQADVVITHDTGIMHIAAAFKKKIISIWGNTIPEFGMSPYLPDNDSAIFEVGGLKCRPCSKIGYKRCPKKHFNCMKLHDEREIAAYAHKLFTRQ